MSNLAVAVMMIIWAVGQIINGDYGFAIADFLLAGLNIFVYLIDRNEEAKKAFEKVLEELMKFDGR